MAATSSYSDALIETVVDGGYLPHFVLRRGIRRQLQQRLDTIATTDLASAYETKMKYVYQNPRGKHLTYSLSISSTLSTCSASR